LIVDDDPMIRKLIATTLEDVSGYRLQEAANGIEAIERAVEARPEIVFLDVDMPRVNGIERDDRDAHRRLGTAGRARGARRRRRPVPHQAVLAAPPAPPGGPHRHDALIASRAA
jgi:CheY-like chemotaxis protein